MRQVTKEQVILVLGMMFILVAGVCTLAILDKDPTIILTIAGILAVPILGAFGVAVYQKLDQVKEVSNGNLNRAHDDLSRAHDMLNKHAQMSSEALTANTAVLSKLVETLGGNKGS